MNPEQYSPPWFVFITCMLLLVIAFPPVTADSHQLTFTNNCNQPVWVNVQGGPPGICDHDIDPATKTNIKCSACSVCPDKSLCNISVSTGSSLPYCCPLITDTPRCWGGEQCSRDGCCPQIPQTAMKTYQCPGITSTASCQNTSMNYTQTLKLSGYNNATSGFRRPNCSGGVIGGGGFKLNPNGGTRTFDIADGWQGAWFGRTNCTFNAQGEGKCETGDCQMSGWGHLQCSGIGSAPPATKGELNLEITTGIDYYDVSLVDGYNLPMQIAVSDANPSYISAKPADHFRCTAAGCLNTSTLTACPADLRYKPNGKPVGCQDDCNKATALHTGSPTRFTQAEVDAYCCPDTTYCSSINPCGQGSTCKAWLTNKATCRNCSAYTGIYPNGYPVYPDMPNSAIFFHASCPNAYSFTYDDASASYTCNSTPSTGLRTKYTTTFCAPLQPVPTLTLSPNLTPSVTPSVTGMNPADESGSGGSTVASVPAADAAGTAAFPFNQEPTATTPVGIDQVLIVTGRQTDAFAVTAWPVSLGDAMQIQGRPVAGYLQITPVGVPPGAISSAVIRFAVRGTWLEANHIAPENIVLMRYSSNQWNPLPTKFVRRTGNASYFEAATPGFSYFAVTVNTEPAPAAGITVPATTHEPALPAAGTAMVTQVPATDTLPLTPPMTTTSVPPKLPALPAEQSPFPMAGAVIAAGLVVVLAGFLVRRWWIRQQNPALFRETE